MANETYRYGVGTSETGSFVSFDTEAEAREEAKNWAEIDGAKSAVIVWALRPDTGDVVDAICSYDPN